MVKMVTMCGRYTLTTSQKLAKRYNLAKAPQGLRDNFNVAPTQTMPVILADGDEGFRLAMMRWGIPRFIGPGKVKDVFNTRADKAFDSWKKLTMSQRVLIPASGFYEWKKAAGGKQPFYIHPKNADLFSFAGIWNIWKDQNGDEVQTFSIMTTEPNKEMRQIHDRMPVILHQDDESSWATPAHDSDRGAIEALLRPYEDNGLELFEVSSDVNNVRNNNDTLIYPVTTQ
jgi:putative SOS response-associated peptidase YedK